MGKGWAAIRKEPLWICLSSLLGPMVTESRGNREEKYIHLDPPSSPSSWRISVSAIHLRFRFYGHPSRGRPSVPSVLGTSVSATSVSGTSVCAIRLGDNRFGDIRLGDVRLRHPSWGHPFRRHPSRGHTSEEHPSWPSVSGTPFKSNQENNVLIIPHRAIQLTARG